MSMLNTGISALLTTQGSLSTTSHNISNANTEGYHRQRVNQAANLPAFHGSYYIGNGVNIAGVERIFDNFLMTQSRNYTSQEAQQSTFLRFSKEVDGLLGSSELGLNASLKSLFNAVHGVANDPTSTAARQVLVTEGKLLTDRFNTLDQRFNQFGRQIDNALSTSIKDINIISAGIAELNQQIVAVQSASINDKPNDLFDKRDKLISDLSKYVSVDVIPESTGALNVFIGNGQALVVGKDNFNLHEITDTSTNPARTSIGYGPSQVDIAAQLTGGSIGGSLQVRREVIDQAQAELDTLAQSIAEVFNTQNRKGVTLNGTIGGDFFAVPTPPATVDAATIRMAITDPNAIAAAMPVGVTNADITTVPPTLASGSGKVTIDSIDATPPLTLPLLTSNIQLTYNATTQQYTASDGVNTATIAYDPNTDAGKSFSFTSPMAEISISLTGVPQNGDVITLNNSNSPGDNRNVLSMANIQTAKVLSGGTKTLSEFYGVTVANVATKTHQADIGQKTQKGLLEQVNLRQQSTSGVNLDEEAANLIKFQQSYQAASQIITVSNTVFNSLINAM